MGEGQVEDVTTHPATHAMVEEYAAWYDRHLDPAWQDLLLTPPNGDRERIPLAYVMPKSAEDLTRMGRSFAKTTFLSAGNITHTPAYGNLIALGVLTALQAHQAPNEQIAEAISYREQIARSGRFLTYCGGAPIIGQRMRPDPRQRVALELVRESDAGVVIRGKLGMHTSPAYAEDVYIGALTGIEIGGHRAGLILPVNAPGATTLCRKIVARDRNPFVAPLSSRFDELDGQMWLDDVFVPWERVFFVDPSPEAIARWLRWHHLHGWLSKAEFTLGLALALTHAMGLKEHEQTVVDRFGGRHLVLDGIEKADEFLMPVALHAAPDDLAFKDIEGGEQGGGAIALIIVCHGGAAPLLHRQSGLGAVERLDLALLVDAQDHGMGRRIDVETNHILELLGEFGVVGELECAHPMRLQPVPVPDAPHRGGANPHRLGHRRCGPMGRLMRRGLVGQANDAIDGRGRQGRDARGSGLVTGEPLDPLTHEPLLPAPDHGFTLADGAHDGCGALRCRRSEQ